MASGREGSLKEVLVHRRSSSFSGDDGPTTDAGPLQVGPLPLCGGAGSQSHATRSALPQLLWAACIRAVARPLHADLSTSCRSGWVRQTTCARGCLTSAAGAASMACAELFIQCIQPINTHWLLAWIVQQL